MEVFDNKTNKYISQIINKEQISEEELKSVELKSDKKFIYLVSLKQVIILDKLNLSENLILYFDLVLFVTKMNGKCLFFAVMNQKKKQLITFELQNFEISRVSKINNLIDSKNILTSNNCNLQEFKINDNLDYNLMVPMFDPASR